MKKIKCIFNIIIIFLLIISCSSSNKDNKEYKEVISTNVYKSTNGKQIARVHFDFNKFNLTRDFIDIETLSNLKTNTNILKLYIYGNTDNKGKDWWNYKLGLRRALTVSNIISTNLHFGNIILESFSYNSPIADNKTESGRYSNRRVDIFIDFVEETFEIQTNLIKVDSKNEFNILSRFNINLRILLIIILVILLLLVLLLLLLLAPKISSSLLLSGSKIAKFFGELIIIFCKGFKYKLNSKYNKIPKTKKLKMDYIKKPRDIKGIERKKFDSGIRKNFIKELYEKYGYSGLKNIGFSDSDILKIKDGKCPNGFQVHHKFPLDDSGNNDFSNLILIRNFPYHLTITNYQNSFMSELNINGGILKNIDFPYVLGDILF